MAPDPPASRTFTTTSSFTPVGGGGIVPPHLFGKTHFNYDRTSRGGKVRVRAPRTRLEKVSDTLFGDMHFLKFADWVLDEVRIWPMTAGEVVSLLPDDIDWTEDETSRWIAALSDIDLLKRNPGEKTTHNKGRTTITNEAPSTYIRAKSPLWDLIRGVLEHIP